MSASRVLRRTLFTTATTTAHRTSPHLGSRFPPGRAVPRIAYLPQHQPLTTTRHFSATMGKEGVHNLRSKAEFDDALAEKGTLMVLDCFATWCGPCKVIAPQVVKFSESYSDARFYKIDVDEVPDVAQELSIRAMPTFLLFKDGEKVGEVVGANKTALEAAIKSNV